MASRRKLPFQAIFGQVARAGRRRVRDQIMMRPRGFGAVREDVARMYVRGNGIEIGALNSPLRVPPSVEVRYVDYLPIHTLRRHHAHLVADGQTLVVPDVIDDGELLESFADESVDFVIASHFIEHCEDPIGALAAHLRVVRRGGILLQVLPDKRFSFDVARPITSLDHLIRDHDDGPKRSRQEHYREWAEHVDKVAQQDIERHAADLAARRFSIHFHVWTPSAYLHLLLHCQAIGLPFDIDFFRQNNKIEFITVLRKTNAPVTTDHTQLPADPGTSVP